MGARLRVFLTSEQTKPTELIKNVPVAGIAVILLIIYLNC